MGVGALLFRSSLLAGCLARAPRSLVPLVSGLGLAALALCPSQRVAHMDVAEDGALLSPASDSSQPPATPLQRLEECITMLIERHREICIIAKDFNEESQPLLFTKMYVRERRVMIMWPYQGAMRVPCARCSNDLVLLYRELDALKGSCDVMVPRDVIAYVSNTQSNGRCQTRRPDAHCALASVVSSMLAATQTCTHNSGANRCSKRKPTRTTVSRRCRYARVATTTTTTWRLRLLRVFVVFEWLIA